MKIEPENSEFQVMMTNRTMIIRILIEKFNMPEEKALEFLNKSIKIAKESEPKKKKK